MNYLNERRAMLSYAHFQAQGYPIGSGSVESANKLVVQSRMKGAGMRWEPDHVNAMLAMRNVACNDRWEEDWPEIRQVWQQQVQATWLQRAVSSASTRVSEPSPPPPVLPTSPTTQSAVSVSKAEPQPALAVVEQPGGQRSRPATTHSGTVACSHVGLSSKQYAKIARTLILSLSFQLLAP